MSNTLEYILKLKDMLTPSMRQAASISNSSAVQIQQQFDKIDKSGKKMASSVDELRQRLDAVNKVRFGTQVQREFDIATRAANKLERQIDQMEGKGKKGAGSGGMLGGIVKGNLISRGIETGLGIIKDGIGDTYQSALKDSSLRTAINSTTGGQGAEAVKKTSAISDKYGLNYEASLEGVKTLTGGLKSMNMPLAEQMKIFEGVSTGIAAMKLGAEESKGAMLALGQMASKGVVSAEELRGQLGERIPGAFGIAAKSMGVTEAQLGKMLERGEIAAKDFLPKFAAEMQKTFGEDALKAANGPAAMQERFNNAIYNMKVAIGEGLMPVITPVIQKLTELATIVIPYIQSGIEYVISLFQSVNSGTSEWSEYINIVRSILISSWNTIKSLASNVWNIVSGIVEWVKKSELMKDLAWAIGKAFEGIQWVIKQIGDAIEWIWDNTIKPILDAVEWIYSNIKGLFGGGKTEVVVTDGTRTATIAAQPAFDNSEFEKAQFAFDAKHAKNKMLGVTTPINPKNNGGLSSSKSDSINNGGQKSIVINIGKIGEKIEQHIVGGTKEAAEGFASVVREEVLRTLYSLNNVAV
ncbi:MAG: hypothetical protein ABS68_00270 [Niastella sp. SCN 39-18]|nr:tape measure protein [Sphingobacteriales bacterium]ODT55186.1 MAG: hypothetical protein ABS68_00270 [Niastella sp. SCN 39-18]